MIYESVKLTFIYNKHTKMLVIYFEILCACLKTKLKLVIATVCSYPQKVYSEHNLFKTDMFMHYAVIAM